ncbi:MAG: CRISPR-associated protein Csx18 [Coleofasciculus sp. C2-GNP5-27]
MYISHRAIRVRNSLVALLNGSITLIILLIAPLGLAAVMINTVLVAMATYGVSAISDRVILWLHPVADAEFLSPGVSNSRRLRRQHWYSGLEKSRH